MKPGVHLGMATQPAAWAPAPGRDGGRSGHPQVPPTVVTTTSGAGGGHPHLQVHQQQEMGAPSPSTYAGAAASGLQSSQAAPAGALEWKEYTLPETGQKYYHNTRTGKTQWERPNQVNLGVLKW